MRRIARTTFPLVAALPLAAFSCAREVALPAPPPPPGLVEVAPQDRPAFTDDSDVASLLQCINQSLDQLGRLPLQRAYDTAGQPVSVSDLRRTLAILRDGVLSSPRPIDWAALLRRFRILRPTPPGGFLFTGYFQSDLAASRERTERFRHPIYRVPDDLVQIDLSAKCPTCTRDVVIGRVEDGDLEPYPSRADIDGLGVLAGRDLELAWLDDPIDVFFLHVQGSGLLRFEDGTGMEVSFAGSNGRDYRSIGKLLVERGKVPLERASMQSLKQYLRENPGEQDAILFANERYIFFRPVPVGPIGSLGVPLTPGRSIAVDPGAYPLGSLAFIRTERPGEDGAPVPLARFACAQDAGAAISGPGRVDVFWGAGPDAERIAGAMRAPGDMYLLLAH